MVDDEDEPQAKKALFMNEDEDSNPAVATNLRERRTGSQEKSETSPLTECLNYLHRILQRKDVNGIFAFPVTDSIAPGYSSIITQPMDFSTMKTKIDDGDYNSVAEFKRDFKLMCNNCCVYNRPETIFYQEAKRLMTMGVKQMSKVWLYFC